MTKGPPGEELDRTQTDDSDTRGGGTEARTQAIGTRVDRYVILELVGHGGMGVVYKAYDPELDRPIALKFLRITEGEGTSGAEARLLREAQALAQLSHPNVVTVFDVGVFCQQVFMAMEYVEGQTLREWSEEESRSPSEVLEILIPAGRGLAAAHRAGLIHRDVKPDNILIGADGRVRVVDFGLARGRSDTEAVISHSGPAAEAMVQGDLSEVSGSGRRLGTPLTKIGSIVGTPPYMSPEQHSSGEVDAASDQFSFCVTAYEALVGHRPFAGRTRSELVENVNRGLVIPAPSDTLAPLWVLQVLARGLMLAREDRFADMESLLSALEDDPIAARRVARAARRRAALSALLGVTLAGALFAGWSTLGSAPQLCRGASSRAASVWTPAIASGIEGAFVATGHPKARGQWSKVNTLLSQYIGRWSEMHVDACEATRVRGEQSETMLNLRMTCLDGRLRQVGALLDVLAEPDADLVDRAATDAQKLGHLSLCENTEYLRRSAGLIEPVAGPEQQAKVDALAPMIARIDALEKTGRLPQGDELGEAAVASADRAGYRPAQAEARYHRASILERLSRWDEAETLVGEALYLADASGHEVYRARAANLYALLLGYRYRKFKVAVYMEQQARAAIERLDNDETLLSEWYNQVTLNRMEAGEFDDAIAQIEKASEINRRLYGPTHIRVASDLTNLGVVNMLRGRYGEALVHLNQAYEVWEKLLGSDNLRVASTLYSLGVAHHGNGNPEQALTYFQRALDIRLKNHGPRHRRVADIMTVMGAAHLALDSEKLANERFAAAASIFDELDDADGGVAAAVGLGQVALAEGDPQRAAAQFEVALGLCRDNACADSDTGKALFNAAKLSRDHRLPKGKPRALATQALAILRAQPSQAAGVQEIEAWMGSASR